MIYTADITTDEDTQQDSLKHTVLQVTKGLVYKVEFYFPSGSAGLMGVAVFDGSFQVWPSTVGKFFVSDNETIRFDDMYLKNAAPYQFDIYTYNEDDKYPHVVGVRIGLVSQDVFLARFLPYQSYDYFIKLLRQMEEERAEQAAIQKQLIKETPFEWLVRTEQEGL